MRKTSDILWQDVQHQVLFDILDLISEPGAGADVVFRLQQYTDNHFELEERYMEELGYPVSGTQTRSRPVPQRARRPVAARVGIR